MTNWTSRYISSTPSREELVVPRAQIDGATCPQCGGTDIQRYPVACAVGARMATTCQTCLDVLKLERPTAEDDWPPFRAATYDWEASLCERASRRELDAPAGSQPQ
jgi:hypothetical protein